MEWLYEKPLFIVVMGLLTVAVLGAAWLQTGRKQALYALVAVLALTGTLLLVERTVETDREQIDTTLHHIARLVERNDIDAALRYAHSQADVRIRRQAKAELPQYEFHRISIKRNLEIALFAEESPPRAVAEFNVMVVLSERSGPLKESRIPRFVIVTFWKEGDVWRPVDYEHHDPGAGFRRRQEKPPPK